MQKQPRNQPVSHDQDKSGQKKSQILRIGRTGKRVGIENRQRHACYKIASECKRKRRDNVSLSGRILWQSNLRPRCFGKENKGNTPRTKRKGKCGFKKERLQAERAPGKISGD